MFIASNDIQTSKASYNTMSANTAVPMFLIGCETEMHTWKYG